VAARSAKLRDEISPEHGKKRKAKDVAKLPSKILTDSAATAHITPDVFQAMIDEKVDRQTQQKVYENLTGNMNSLTREMQSYLRSPMVQNRYGSAQGGRGRSQQRQQSRVITPEGQIDTSGLSLEDN
jgi:hypothetical protein